jgi:putative peptidoglycan lipid II flippase
MSKLVKAGIIVFIISALSKVLGFLRETFLAFYFGTSYESDAYFIALTPSTLAITFALSLSSVFLPLYVKHSKDKKSAFQFSNNIISIFSIAIALCYGLLFLNGGIFVNLIAPGLPDYAEKLSIDMLKVLFPLAFICIVIQVYTDILNSHERFSVPVLSLLPNNLIIIVYLMLFGREYGIEAVAYITIIAFIVQLFILYYYLRKDAYRITISKNIFDLNTKEFMLLVIPVLLSSVINQVNSVVDRLIASTLSEGSISALMYSFRLRSVITGIFITGIITVTFPKISKLALKMNKEELVKMTQDSLQMIFLIVGPVSIYLMLFSREIIEVLFERGEFNSNATIATAGVFLYYSLGLLFIGILEIVVRNFYALGDTKSPTIIIIVSLLINMLASYIFVKWMGLAGLGLSSTLGIAISVVMLNKKISKILPTMWSKGFLISCVKIVISIILSGLLVHYIIIITPILDWHNSLSIITKIVYLILYFIFYLMIYVCALLLLKEKLTAGFLTKIIHKIR